MHRWQIALKARKRAETYGFDSVWVRDHLVFEPHGIEGSDNTHVEGLLVLSAIAAVTNTISLGTSMAICHRHPIYLAQLFAGLSVISRGRVIMGMGLGGFPHEFAAAGYPTAIEQRAELVRSNVQICRRLWAGERVSFKDEYFHFADVALKPLSGSPDSNLVRRWHTGRLPARGGVLRRLDAGANHAWRLSRNSSVTFESSVETRTNR